MFELLTLPAHNPGPMTGPGNNTYLLVDAGEATLVDAGVGHPDHLSAIAAALAAHRARLTSVLVTHAHGDHAAGAPALAAAYPNALFLKRPWPEFDVRYAAPWQPIDETAPFSVGREALAVIHTPGHSPDHLSLWHQQSATLFTGDLVVKGSSVMIHASGGGDLGDYLASLERLIAMAPRRLLPAHGPAIDDPLPLLRRYIEHRLDRERQVLEALAAGCRTVQAITEFIYHGLAPDLMRAAGENVQAHLEKLRREGLATRHGDARGDEWQRSTRS
jgi:glyoxylase-like metal-dependent hydrolase (beta-lactamase superfamily II)